MKLYRHYKKKHYKYRSLARHSETLEELVLYETRYDTEYGRVWVRPKELFHSDIEIDGKMVPRFEKIQLNISNRIDVKDSDIQIIAPLIEKIFGEWDAKWFYSIFNNYKKFLLLIGYIEDQAVGFKLGYEHDREEFYSWLGGVLPDYRNLGIARDLMLSQHEWCKQQGYKKVQTKTQNRFKEMLLLNLQNGFEVVGTHPADKHGLKIVLEKIL